MLYTLIRNIVKKRKRKIDDYPQKRRAPDYETARLWECVKLKYIIPKRSMEKAMVTNEIEKEYPEFKPLVGKMVEILFLGNIYSQVQTNSDEKIIQVPTKCLDFNFIEEKPFDQETIEKGEYFRLKKEIRADDISNDLLGEEGETVIFLDYVKDSSNPYDYLVYKKKTDEGFRVKKDEVERLFKRIPVTFE